MSFNSLQFAIFLGLVFVLYWALAPYRRPRNWLLLISSYYFYMSWNAKYAVIMAASTLLDYLVSLGLDRWPQPIRRKLLLTVTLIGNLGSLALFKYYNFFLDSFQALLGSLGMSASGGHLHLLLPVGISFYTFQTLSYTIDVYRGQLKPCRSLVDFSVFVTFFPQLVAGPIVRASDFLWQMETQPRYDDQRTLQGLARIFRGLIKKIVIADTLAMSIVDPVFAAPGQWSGMANLLAAYAYAIQIYCDFSGYSDVAIGAARMLGFDLLENFRRPYLAVSVRDFWDRWHISLSTWLRDYLYIPLGGNRQGRWNTYRNLAITMLLGGLWHGGAWNFVAWGAFHGGWLMLNRAFGCKRKAEEMGLAERWLRRGVTFHLVCFGWVLFRGGNMTTIQELLGQVLTLASGPGCITSLMLVTLAMGFAIHWWADQDRLSKLQGAFVRAPAALQGAVYTALLVLFAAMAGVSVPFIYFQF